MPPLQKDYHDNVEYPIEEAINDPAKMLVNELIHGQASVTEWLQIKDDRPLQVRPDFGIGLIASVFGAAPQVVDNNPPWIPPLFTDDIENNIENMLDSFEPGRSVERSWIPRVSETLGFYHSALKNYPSVSAAMAVVMPDLQGPFDTAAMLWGSSWATPMDIMKSKLSRESTRTEAFLTSSRHVCLREPVKGSSTKGVSDPEPQ